MQAKESLATNTNKVALTIFIDIAIFVSFSVATVIATTLLFLVHLFSKGEVTKYSQSMQMKLNFAINKNRVLLAIVTTSPLIIAVTIAIDSRFSYREDPFFSSMEL